jgi:DNA-directed RNA polymerase sigma subunit (sigma70/sigma32)
MLAKTVSEDRRKAIFQALVDAQDQGMAVPESRKEVAERYHITEDEVRQIEREGLEMKWPPL